MKTKLLKVFSFILSVVILCNVFYSISYAKEYSEEEIEEMKKKLEDTFSSQDKWKQTENTWWTYIMSQSGALFHGDMKQIRENDETRRKELAETWDNPQWRKDNIKLITGDGTPKISISKEVSQFVLDTTKKANKEPENGGYELLKTVPASKISSLYFNDNMNTASMYNLLKDNNGVVGVYSYYGTICLYKIPQNIFYVKDTFDYSYDSVHKGTFNRVKLYKNLTSSSISLTGYSPRTSDGVIKSWDDSENIYCYGRVVDRYSFSLYDYFSFWTDMKKGKNPIGNQTESNCAYIVTNSGVSIPVFNTVDDAVAYSVSNNLYYTGSDYTGEGKEIIIEFDQLDNITNGYYDDMYILLQQMIENQGGNALTPEQLQQLVDEVRASFGLIKDEINKGFQQQDILIQKNSSILQNIADALNAFFAETKRFRESMDKMMRDFIDGQKYTPPNQTDDKKDDNTGTGTDVDIGDGTGDTGGGLLKKLYDTVKDGFADVVKQLKSIKRWTALDTVIDGAGVITDIISFVTDLLNPDKAADAVAEFVANGADALVGVKDLVTGKFPFCIPTDILALMQTLAHEPETPVFEIPFVLERYGIDEKVVIDLKDFQIISDISRTFLTILWCCTLMNVTTKITDMKSI